MSALHRLYRPLSRFALMLFFAVLPVAVMAEESGIRVSGTVMDAQKEPLIGVSISVDGTTLGTITDFDGHFYLTVPDKKSKLNISYIGYK
ncbi:MAG: carboxypeptidase-like regulatory domain-containing protein, partial [Paludibacteraceae bacterium]